MLYKPKLIGLKPQWCTISTFLWVDWMVLIYVVSPKVSHLVTFNCKLDSDTLVFFHLEVLCPPPRSFCMASLYSIREMLDFLTLWYLGPNMEFSKRTTWTCMFSTSLVCVWFFNALWLQPLMRSSPEPLWEWIRKGFSIERPPVQQPATDSYAYSRIGLFRINEKMTSNWL